MRRTKVRAWRSFLHEQKFHTTANRSSDDFIPPDVAHSSTFYIRIIQRSNDRSNTNSLLFTNVNNNRASKLLLHFYFDTRNPSTRRDARGSERKRYASHVIDRKRQLYTGRMTSIWLHPYSESKGIFNRQKTQVDHTAFRFSHDQSRSGVSEQKVQSDEEGVPERSQPPPPARQSGRLIKRHWQKARKPAWTPLPAA